MKTPKFILFVLAIFLISCKDKSAFIEENRYWFEAPQPINDSELSHIPTKFHGRYSDNNNQIVQIFSDLITREKSSMAMFHKKELDSLKNHFDLKDNFIVDKQTKEIFSLKTINDSLQITAVEKDTIFKFSDQSIAKRLHGQVVFS